VTVLQNAPLAERPLVSIVVPMLDEIGFIRDCLDGFAAQTYGVRDVEVVVVDGGSTDGSRELIDAMAEERPWIRVVDNPQRRASAAFNRGVEAAKGDVVCLFSAHGVPSRDYVAASVRSLRETGAGGVGGRYLHEGHDAVSNAVGRAMVSPFGMASSHRFADARREVDTISHPAYRAAALADVGPFDETLLRNSDYELNFRLREHGYALWFDPAIESVYRPRSSLRSLGRQFWWYGRWKARVARRHPSSLRTRHVVPPAAVAAGALAPLAALHPAGRRLIVAGAALYGALVIAAVVHARPRAHAADPKIIAASFPVMHAAWGAGFLASLVEDAGRRA
jgi:glycosyltransferase involved in cell wall biosynthesis